MRASCPLPLGTQESRSFQDQSVFSGGDVQFDKEEFDLKLAPAWINTFRINLFAE